MKQQLPASATYRKLSDDELAHRYAHKADRQAALQLFERYGHLIYGVCLALTGSSEQARSLAQSVYFKVLDGAGQYRTGAFKPWLYNFVLNEAGAMLGHKDPKQVDPNLFVTELPVLNHSQEEAQFHAAVAAAFATLSADEKSAIRSFYQDHLTHSEIAGARGASAGSVLRLISNGRSRLLAALPNAVPGPRPPAFEIQPVLHMLEAGHCLTRKQVASYCGSLTSAEEVLAVEHHLHACPFCRDTVEAISKGGSDAQQTLAQLDDRFLTEHFKKHSPQVHLNSMAIPVRRARKSSPWRTIGLAAAVIVGIGFWWFSQSRTRQQEAVASEMNVIPDNPSATSVTGGEPLHTAPQSRKEPSTVVQAAVRTPVAAPKSTRKEKHVQEELPLVTDAGKLVNPKREPAPKKETSSVEKSKLESMPNAVPETKISAEPEMGPIPMPEAPPKENKDPE